MGAFGMIELLEDYCAREQVPGVAICTFDSTGPTAVSCHGVAAAGCINPVRPDTVFRIYSLTKLLTACAVVQLVRDGRADLDSPLSNYVTDLTRRPGPHATIGTVRQALSHTGGTVPDSLTWAPMGRNVDDLAVDVIRDYARAFSFAAPGRHYGYSNAGFNLAAVLIEQVTGRPFADAMAELVHQPAGMTVTTHDPAVAMTYPLAQHHLVTDVPRGPAGHPPAAGGQQVDGRFAVLLHPRGDGPVRLLAAARPARPGNRSGAGRLPRRGPTARRRDRLRAGLLPDDHRGRHDGRRPRGLLRGHVGETGRGPGG
jgi:CubicO group peptidase (beta-lactamase class C family)